MLGIIKYFTAIFNYTLTNFHTQCSPSYPQRLGSQNGACVFGETVDSSDFNGRGGEGRLHVLNGRSVHISHKCHYLGYLNILLINTMDEN